MDGPTTPLLRVCNSRPRGWTDNDSLLCASAAIGRMYDDVVTRVPLHDLASRGPSAPNLTDGRTNTEPTTKKYKTEKLKTKTGYAQK